MGMLLLVVLVLRRTTNIRIQPRLMAIWNREMRLLLMHLCRLLGITVTPRAQSSQRNIEQLNLGNAQGGPS